MKSASVSPIVFAHRGFRGLVPENTIRAAAAGFEIGADWWELDVAASSDGELFVIHDDSLARTTDAAALFPGRAPWTVYDFTAAELARLDAGAWYEKADPFGQVRSGRVGRVELAGFRGLRIPTLREALEFTRSKSWKVDVEIKDASGHACDAWIVERVVELIRALGMTDSVLVSSFNHEYIVRAKAAEPRLLTGALVEEPVADPVALLKRTGAEAFNPGLEILSEKAVRAVRAAGKDVFVWTVNELPDMERILGWGVTGIFTDFPDRLLGLLGRKGR
ncbi:MAG: glycerophosphodiester phosphodiesterase family protein [Treponema sp.]|nr:glycerophosphodiester phosphodiesterase family protein [Treponema sp.]